MKIFILNRSVGVRKVKKNKFYMKLCNNLLKELDGAKKIEIYLINEDAIPYSNYKDTFTCRRVFLKTDEDKLFRIEGVVEDFGVDSDEVFGINLKEGWEKFEVLKSDNITEIRFEEENLKNHTDLFLYDIFTKEKGSGVEVRSFLETFNEGDVVEVDEAIVFKRNNQSIYIGQDTFPFNIIITKDEEYLKQLEE